MIRVHVEAGKNTNSVMGRISVEAMKFHALAERARVETMAASVLEKSPISCGFAKPVDIFPLTNGLETDGRKSDIFRCKLLDLFPRTSAAADIIINVSSHTECVVVMTRTSC